MNDNENNAISNIVIAANDEKISTNNKLQKPIQKTLFTATTTTTTRS
jgi:hypothetical protein